MLRAAGRRPVSVLIVLAIAGMAAAIRLAAVFRGGGGLFNDGNYDDAVHYAAAVGLVQGQMPYEDFLFLHPPGIVVALAPFAALGAWTSDGLGLATARLAWMLLGGLNAALIVLILRRIGPTAALTGGLFYAAYFPAIYSEHLTLLEALGTTGLLVALVIGRLTEVGHVSVGRVVAAGLLAGAGTSVKAWGVVPVLMIAVWLLARADWRRSLLFLAAGIAGCSAICLPFFLNAPRAMWQMVVLDQLGRPANPSLELTRKLYDIAGLRWEPMQTRWLLLGLALLGAVLMAAALAAGQSLFVLLLAVELIVLLMTPIWWVHYASYLAGPLALTVGSGMAQIRQWMRPRDPHLDRAVVSLLAITGIVVYGLPLLHTKLQAPFPGNTLRASVVGVSGCVTSDQPIALIETDVLTRNLRRGCRHIVDIRGYAHHRSSSTWAPQGRTRSRGWQTHTLSYVRSGDLFISAHFSATKGFDKPTAVTVESWPVVARAGRYVVRKPQR